MKVIDLLNKIANGEEVPQTIKYEEMIFEYDYLSGMYVDKESYLTHYIDDTGDLKEKIEIIEEPKKIEKIKINSMGNIADENNHILPVTSETDEFLARKLNQIIDCINKGE